MACFNFYLIIPSSFQVNNGVPDRNILEGKIINLNIECTGSFLGPSLTFGNCLVFKLNGKEKCELNQFLDMSRTGARRDYSLLLPAVLTAYECIEN